jgi:outer membrane biosynthesis protein TonB
VQRRSAKRHADANDRLAHRQSTGDNTSKKRNFEFSVTQIVSGALAAMTAAALGSQLSAAGTIVGAALASVIAAVAGSLYTASLRRTRDKVKTVFWTGEPNEVQEPTVMEIIPDSEGHIAGQRSHLVAPEPDPNQKPQGPKLNWKRVLVVALVTFGIAAVALTTFEVVTGQALSGGKGTTFQQVSEGTSDKGSETKKKEPTKKPTPEATKSASEQPTAEPRAQASNSQPEATTESTTEAPTPEASNAPSSTPSSGG